MGKAGWIASVFAVSLLLVTRTSVAQALGATDCSAPSVQAAIDAAADGDTVTIPEGNCTWSTEVSIPSTKGITLKGSGIDRTTILDAVPGGFEIAVLEINLSPGRHVTRVTGLSINADLSTKSGMGAVILVKGGGLNSFRIDHVRLYNIRQRGIQVNSKGLELGGVIDHSTFECPGDYACHAIDVLGSDGGLGSPFSRGLALGTADFVFVEDCVFNYSYKNDGVLDAYSGARFVFRFNTVNGGNIGHHGADSGGYRGVHSFENYGNVFNNAGSSLWLFMYRSGTGVHFGNTYNGNYTAGHLSVYRVNQAYSPWGKCDGSSVWDGKVGSGANAGWPCLDQTGHVFTDSPTGSYATAPMYFWTNVVNGGPAAGPVPNNPAEANYLVANRDFYDNIAAFDGTSGVGHGTARARPVTCTPGVAYWATDEGDWNILTPESDGQLYTCTRQNTWSLYYTPYLYPHPLVATRPAAPTNVAVK